MANETITTKTKERLAGEICTDLNPERVKGNFICYYILASRDESRKPSLEHFSKRIPELGLEGVLNIYSNMEEQFNLYVKTENYELAGELKNAMKYFMDNIIDKMPSTKIL